MKAQQTVYRSYAYQRMFERGITTDQVEDVPNSGEIIEDYPDDYPYPSRLVLGSTGGRRIHVVVAENTVENQRIVVTVYVPDPLLWDADYRIRRTP